MKKLFLLLVCTMLAANVFINEASRLKVSRK